MSTKPSIFIDHERILQHLVDYVNAISLIELRFSPQKNPFQSTAYERKIDAVLKTDLIKKAPENHTIDK